MEAVAQQGGQQAGYSSCRADGKTAEASQGADASKASSKAPRERVSMLPRQAIQDWFSPFRQPAAVIQHTIVLVPGSSEASELAPRHVS